MVDKHQMKDLIQSTLTEMGDRYASKDACNLVWCTGLVESDYRYIRQIDGPARGFFQIEPQTCSSAVENYFKYRKKLQVKAAEVTSTSESLWDDTAEETWDAVLESNIRAGIVHCRIKYWRAPASMPDSIQGYAEYWKRHYNTLLGKGEVEHFLRKVKKYVHFL
ncbi:hypothetical protein CMI37_24550 [Candidatus Pacearchaeota archaeon]|jgi:hypothetical protein|nr:hypothetical protein [Candidatus Pacearchaeota archaeon]|tara:strand:- start:4304 stop:4795 length:492 start_codon:yes stop_codon:yes gene_type:complete